jgi:hypothetical protein
MRITPRLVLVFTLSCCGAFAHAQELAPEPAPQPAADGWWQKTRAYADSALHATQSLWQEQGGGDARLWDDLIPRLDEILDLRDRHAQLPSWSWIGEDQQSNQEDMDGLFDQAAQVLIGDNPYRQQLRAIASASAQRRALIAELKRAKLTAPEGSVWRKTVRDIDDEIAHHQAFIDEQQKESARLRQQFAAELKRLGLNIDEGQLEFLLSTVVGDDVVDMASAFEQVRGLTEQLETLTTDSHEDIHAARRYYGMYMVLLQLLDQMHGNLISRIDADYLPRIRAIDQRARTLNQQTRRLQSQQPSVVLQANLQAQQLTLEAAARYSDYLQRQQQQVRQSRARLARDLAVAENTYETVKVSGDLVTLMKDSHRLLDTLFSLQVPSLRAFENLDMQREFKRLTESLKQQANEDVD